MNDAAPAGADSARWARQGEWGAWTALLGIFASGPLAVAWVEATHPQPVWQGPEIFARHYHPQQILPYAAGLLLVAAVLLLFSSLHALAPARLLCAVNGVASLAGTAGTVGRPGWMLTRAGLGAFALWNLLFAALALLAAQALRRRAQAPGDRCAAPQHPPQAVTRGAAAPAGLDG